MTVAELIALLHTVDPRARVDVVCATGVFPLGGVSPSQGTENSVTFSPDYNVWLDRPGSLAQTSPRPTVSAADVLDAADSFGDARRQSELGDHRLSSGQAWLVAGVMTLLAAAMAFEAVVANREGAPLARQSLLGFCALLCLAFGILSLFAESKLSKANPPGSVDLGGEDEAARG
jgi:hypothetical protein